jgi:Ca2+-binding RTX toxin-like protein
MTVTATSGSNAVSTGSGDDTIDAGTGDDTIDAGDGANTITGGAGSDNITFGAGADTVVFNSLSGVDGIAGFDVASDTIQLSKAVFDALSTVGAMATAEFEAGADLIGAATAEGRIVYDTTTGDLYYDADGSGAGAAVLIGTVTGAPTLTFDLFTIIA